MSPTWAALPLGLFDDLMTGQMLGTSMATWTFAFLIFDWIDHRTVWRDFWMEWVIAAATILIVGLASWAVSRSFVTQGSVIAILPSSLGAILLFPTMMRLTAMLDRWRLGG